MKISQLIVDAVMIIVYTIIGTLVAMAILTLFAVHVPLYVVMVISLVNKLSISIINSLVKRKMNLTHVRSEVYELDGEDEVEVIKK